MSDDTTIHFPHAATHPAVMYVPRHLVDHSSPTWGSICVAVGIAFVIAAGVLLRRSSTRTAKAFGAVFLLAATPILYEGGRALTAGTYVDVLPSKSHVLATSDPGDNPHQYFFSREDALAEARYVGSPRVPDSSARAVAVKWEDIPAEDRAKMKAPDAELDDLVPPQTSWSTQDSSIIDNYLNSTYGIVPLTENDSHEDLREVVVPPNDSNDPTYQNLANTPQLQLPDDRMRLQESGDGYRCRLHLTAYRTNELNQPVSAEPGKLECFSAKDTADSDHPVTANTPRVYPKKIK